MEQLKGQIPDYAREVRLNLTSMLADEALPPQSKHGVLLAAAIATRNLKVIAAVESAATAIMTPAAVEAVKATASVMAMNNVYHRFVHFTSNPEYKMAPTRLWMEVMDGPGIDKVDLELWSLAFSAINGCGACMAAHEKALEEAWLSTSEILAVVRFAAIVQSVATAIEAAGPSTPRAAE